jgi:hypothetical protein
VPRGAEEGSVQEVDRENLQLVANRPVAFRLYSSLTRADDIPGQVVEFAADDPDVHQHAPLHAVIRFGKRVGDRLIPVKIGARLTEIGTLETWAESKISENRWRLQFELRKSAGAEAPAARKPAAVISEEAIRQSTESVRAVFSSVGKSPMEPEALPGKLEHLLGLARNSWPLETIRKLADAFLDSAEGRKKSPAYEVRWLSLGGFCLRPGFGFPGDDYRLEQARRVYAAGLQYRNQVQCEIEWWIFWGRVAGGLNRNQQTDVYQRLSANLLPRKDKKQRINPSLEREMWRTVASLELLPAGVKTELGEALVRRIKVAGGKETEFWCLSRIGARKLFYGPINLVVPPAAAARWVEAILKHPLAGEALAAIARRTDDPVRDLPPATRSAVRARLETLPHSERYLKVFEGEEDEQELGRVFGEQLPSGLVLTSEQVE